MTSAVLLGQVRRKPINFKLCIQPDETSVSGGIASSCIQLPKAPTILACRDHG